MLAFAPSPVVVIEVVFPFSSVTTIDFFCGSNFKVVTLPVFLSRTTMVPALSSLEMISVSGFMVTAIFAPARPGFFFIKSESKPACFILCMAKKPSTAQLAKEIRMSPTTMPTIHRRILAPELF